MRHRLIAVSILSAGLIISAVVFGSYFYQSRLIQPKNIKVVGAAMQKFTSDIIKWRITINRNVNLSEVSKGYELVKNDLHTLEALMTTAGIQSGEITIQPVNANPVYNQSGIQTGYSISQSLTIISKDLEKVESVALNPASLVEKGIVLQSSNLEYYYSKIDEIKRKLLAQATSDARQRAEEIIKNTGDKVDSIISARAGVFQITEPYSTESMDYGVYNTATKEKDITVTVHVLYNLK